MTEPEYKYRKGQGWVPCIPLQYDSREFVDSSGNWWRIEARNPEYGEHCSWSDSTNLFYVDQNTSKPKLDKWIDVQVGSHPELTCVWGVERENEILERSGTLANHRFITLTKLGASQ